jgi:hypothetical protein
MNAVPLERLTFQNREARSAVEGARQSRLRADASSKDMMSNVLLFSSTVERNALWCQGDDHDTPSCRVAVTSNSFGANLMEFLSSSSKRVVRAGPR